MKKQISNAEAIGKILGWVLGVVIGSVFQTWIGINILAWLGWLPI